MKMILITLAVIEAVPLLVYPFIIIANIMSLAGHKTGDETMLLMVTMYSFLAVSTLYPITYIFATARNVSYWNAEKISIKLQLLPLLHLAIIIGLFILWGRMG